MKKRNWRPDSALVLFLLICLIACCCWPVFRGEEFEPQAHEKTFEGFAKSRPAPKRLKRMQRGGDNYYVWTGETAHLPSLASGPSLYVFDSTGHLHAWSWQTGEGGDIETWVRMEGKEVTVDQVLREMDARKKQK